MLIYSSLEPLKYSFLPLIMALISINNRIITKSIIITLRVITSLRVTQFSKTLITIIVYKLTKSRISTHKFNAKVSFSICNYRTMTTSKIKKHKKTFWKIWFLLLFLLIWIKPKQHASISRVHLLLKIKIRLSKNSKINKIVKYLMMK